MTKSKLVESRLPCPSCPSSDAYHLYDDGHGYCFSCQFYKPSKEEFNSLNYTYEYLPFRGLTKSTLEFYDIKTKIAEDGSPIAVGFKYPNGATKVRKLAEKEFYWESGGHDPNKAGLFGRDKFSAGSHKYVTITEGEVDAASLHQILRSPVVSVQSSSSAHRDCVVDLDWLGSFEAVYLAFDSDRAGREAAARVAKLFDFDKVFLVKFDKRKDANEYLQHREDDELRNIWWNAQRYLPETVVSSFHDFEKILEENPQVGVPYPFESLNEMTYGIRFGESVLITAPTGVGKTEVMHAIEYQLLEKTNDNIGAIYLEEPKAQHLKAIAGIRLQKPVHLPDEGVTKDQILTAVRDVIGTDDRLHLYTHFGSSHPEHLLDTIRFLVSARACRYILLDHISMVVSGLLGEDERKALDYVATRLEMMVKELNFSLIFVSHVNDMGKTRGSRCIEQVADIRIDLSRDVAAGSNIVNFAIVKPSRFVGKSGPAGSYVFDQRLRTYTQMEGNDDGREDISETADLHNSTDDKGSRELAA